MTPLRSLVTVGSLALLMRAEGEHAVRARYAAPVLLIDPATLADVRVDTPASGVPREGETSPFGNRTIVQPPKSRGGDGSIDSTRIVTPVEKSDRNPFASLITVGRAANNDIVIVSPEVSKVHAMIRPRDGGFVIADNGSTNGTFVDAVRLEPKVDRPLKPGAKLSFGPVACHYLTVDDLVELCEMIRA